MKSRLVRVAIIILFVRMNAEANIKSTCGRRLVKHKSLITNGHPTNQGDWPWHAAIYHLKTSFDIHYRCGGTLLNSNSIISAAHCLFENNRMIVADRVLVQLGMHDLKLPGTQNFEAFKLIPHPNYDTTHLRNDIAIIRFATEASFDNYVQPICLWQSNRYPLSDVIGRFGTVIGWGVTETDELSEILRQAVMPVVSPLTCLSSNHDVFGSLLSDTNFCAGFRNGTSVCNGDSGGSMSFEENGVFYIRGIVSLTSSRKDKFLCNTEDYVLFTDVAQYLPWIEVEVPELRRTPSELASSPKSDYINGKRYVLGMRRVNWFQAAQICSLNNMQFAIINSVEEQNIVAKLIHASVEKIERLDYFGVWIGGSDLGVSRNWFWLSNGRPFNYANWHVGGHEPNNEDERCVGMTPEYFEFQWNDLGCDKEVFFVCQEVSI